jgi:hypothetical protein
MTNVTRLTLCFACILLACARPAVAIPVELSVSGTLGNVSTDRLTSPDAATSQGIVSGASIAGTLTIDFDRDLTTLIHGPLDGSSVGFMTGFGLPFLASIEFLICDVSFASGPLSQTTMLISEIDGTIGFIFGTPGSTGNPPFIIDEVFMTLATGSPFNWEAFSSIDPGSLDLNSWTATKFGGDNQLAFDSTRDLEIEEVQSVPEPSTLVYGAVALLVLSRRRWLGRTNRH